MLAPVSTSEYGLRLKVKRLIARKKKRNEINSDNPLISDLRFCGIGTWKWNCSIPEPEKKEDTESRTEETELREKGRSKTWNVESRNEK